MIGLDTNVVIRYLVQDDPIQAKQASRIIEELVAKGEILRISQVTLCEIVWVLERCYHLDKKELIEVIKQLLQTQQICIEHSDVARQALKDYECYSKVDFSECLIGCQNIFNDCVFTYTFDKNAAKLSTFKPVPKKEIQVRVK